MKSESGIRYLCENFIKNGWQESKIRNLINGPIIVPATSFTKDMCTALKHKAQNFIESGLPGNSDSDEVMTMINILTTVDDEELLKDYLDTSLDEIDYEEYNHIIDTTIQKFSKTANEIPKPTNKQLTQNELKSMEKMIVDIKESFDATNTSVTTAIRLLQNHLNKQKQQIPKKQTNLFQFFRNDADEDNEASTMSSLSALTLCDDR